MSVHFISSFCFCPLFCSCNFLFTIPSASVFLNSWPLPPYQSIDDGFFSHKVFRSTSEETNLHIVVNKQRAFDPRRFNSSCNRRLPPPRSWKTVRVDISEAARPPLHFPFECWRWVHASFDFTSQLHNLFWLGMKDCPYIPQYWLTRNC